ncbi:amylo-alpha-1,6-glucosidase [Mesorhizobium sp. BH1-1-5]|uniref:amylo-alpha-1,6-glucosidase n=1 Tax=Mesorhizobium sp. BH1-1-5 TaxID=2876661 RepID=UPI001CCA760E|nr:glycogen debranching N-terminal domain-containing protein [Mesorhizobium sp. BH1-1-5]MBZ9987649.1 amylo-alpha-1,6-glucosidase [Mesorhizobium sp. BH1-1-5]
MTLEIAIGPPRLAINDGLSFLVTDQDGQITWPTHQGLYASDTRLMSSWQIYANGEPWDLLNSGNIAHFAAKIYLVNRLFETETGPVEAGNLGLIIGRALGHGGLHEDFDLVNHGAEAVEFNLEVGIRCDFADLFEVKADSVVRRGRITTKWTPESARLRTSYVNRDFRRAITITVDRTPTKPVYANGRISFDIRLDPGAGWHACLLYDFEQGQKTSRASRVCVDDCLSSKAAKRVSAWRSMVCKLSTPNGEFQQLYNQAIEDMAALRLPIEGTDQLEYVPAAGLPWFIGLFGRDSLIVSLQNSLIYPDFARGALDVLARFQATSHDDYRDAEPGKIMHELRTGELAHFNLIPHTPYYGTADATPLYLIALHNAWRCTGDASLIERHIDTAEKCLDWIDRYGDRDGDGFQEYETRSNAGYENQSWKDADDAVVYPDGTPVKGPKALCELQGYVYDAWQRMAEIYDARGDGDRAGQLRAKAKTLFERFNDVFWDQASGFYALALDGNKKPVLSVASNPGHCLWSGIVAPERANSVVKRLMMPDMWSGWGIRTLSADHRAYNPHSYQRGSVWPHDNGLIALGFRRYGFFKEAACIAGDVSGAASYFMQHRMPELYAGSARTPTTFPVQYKRANVPQAWAAGSCFSFLQAIVGMRADAPNGKLYIDPKLPDWMPEMTLTDLRLGENLLHLRFWRTGPATHWEVCGGDASLVETYNCATGPNLSEACRGT